MGADQKSPAAEAKVMLDKERTLRLDFFATREFKRLTREEGFGPLDAYGRPKGISLIKGELQMEDIDEDTMPILVAACLRHEDPEVDADLVCRYLDVDNMAGIADGLKELVSQFFPQAEEGDGETAEDSPGDGPPSPSSGV